MSSAARNSSWPPFYIFFVSLGWARRSMLRIFGILGAYLWDPQLKPASWGAFSHRVLHESDLGSSNCIDVAVSKLSRVTQSIRARGRPLDCFCVFLTGFAGLRCVFKSLQAICWRPQLQLCKGNNLFHRVLHRWDHNAKEWFLAMQGHRVHQSVRIQTERATRKVHPCSIQYPRFGRALMT